MIPFPSDRLWRSQDAFNHFARRIAERPCGAVVGLFAIAILMILIFVVMLIARFLQTLSEQPRAGDLRTDRPGQGVSHDSWWSRLRLAADPGLRLSQPGTDSD